MEREDNVVTQQRNALEKIAQFQRNVDGLDQSSLKQSLSSVLSENTINLENVKDVVHT